jgi:DNA-binding SARP family transcriptional activator
LLSGTPAASVYGSALELYVPAHTVVLPTEEAAASPVDSISPASSERSIEPASVRSGLRPQEPTAAPISIHVLGGFDLIIDGVRFSSGVKPQRKPLELLKVLLLSDGEPLGAVELADRLWPDSDGDTGRNSLQVAVHRLRRLLRCEPALIMQDRKLRLDGRLCWVDVWAFEREARELSELPVGSSQFAERAIQILRLYRGHLFAHEPEQQWMLAARDRVRRCWLDLVRRLGQHHELRCEWSRACALYQRTLDLDPLEEETYRRLMLGQQKMGERIQALNTYLRCRQQLSAGLGVKPSQETERLHQSLRNAA